MYNVILLYDDIRRKRLKSIEFDSNCISISMDIRIKMVGR